MRSHPQAKTATEKTTIATASSTTNATVSPARKKTVTQAPTEQADEALVKKARALVIKAESGALVTVRSSPSPKNATAKTTIATGRSTTICKLLLVTNNRGSVQAAKKNAKARKVGPLVMPLCTKKPIPTTKRLKPSATISTTTATVKWMKISVVRAIREQVAAASKGVPTNATVFARQVHRCVRRADGGLVLERCCQIASFAIKKTTIAMDKSITTAFVYPAKRASATMAPPTPKVSGSAKKAIKPA